MFKFLFDCRKSKYFLCRMDMVIAAGKSRENVDAYVLLPPDAQRAVDLLIGTRADVGVPSSIHTSLQECQRKLL